MSVVVWDGQSLAADRACIVNGSMHTQQKIFQCEHKVVAFVGTHENGLGLLEWVRKGSHEAQWPIGQTTEEWTVLIVADPFDPKSIYYYERLPIKQYPDCSVRNFFAWGAGKDYALGALSMGASAAAAVTIASEFSIHCGFGVDTFLVKPHVRIGEGA